MAKSKIANTNHIQLVQVIVLLFDRFALTAFHF